MGGHSPSPAPPPVSSQGSHLWSEGSPIVPSLLSWILCSHCPSKFLVTSRLPWCLLLGGPQWTQECRGHWCCLSQHWGPRPGWCVGGREFLAQGGGPVARFHQG